MSIYNLKNFKDTLLSMSRNKKRLIILSTDLLCAIIAVYFAFCLRLDTILPIDLFSLRQGIPSIAAISLFAPIFFITGGYRTLLRLGIRSNIKITSKMLFFYTILYSIIFSIIGVKNIPRSIGILQPVILWILIFVNRITISSILDINKKFNTNLKADLSKVLIYGAGIAGRQLCTSLAMSKDFLVAGFIDDNKNLWHGYVENFPVYPAPNIASIIAKHNITEILVAIPSVNNTQKQTILKKLAQYPVKVKVLPSLEQLALGKIAFSSLREVSIAEVLGRNPVLPNLNLMTINVTGKTVLVTGAGGSIGSELCNQLLQLQPSILILYEMHEFSLYNIEQSLLKKINLSYQPTQIIAVLGNIQNGEILKATLTKFKIDTIYHAAAYKHVPMLEDNPFIGIDNNVFGTLNLVTLSMQHNVQNFVLISTDKAVRPTNVMGTTKRICELILQAISNQNINKSISTTKFSIVRFGNVLGSSGSVIPLFKKQIQTGGPITVTHPDIIRYFMTGEEAAQLVIQAGALSKSGEIMLLDMGEPISIKNLAISMVHLSGLTIKDMDNPDGDIEIMYTGLRAGEKLFEELLIDNKAIPTLHPKIMCAEENYIAWDQLQVFLNELQTIIKKQNYSECMRLLNRIVPEFKTTQTIPYELQNAESVD